MRKWHPDLIAADATITFLFACNPESPALTHGGYPAAALCKVNSLKDRVAGLADLTIMLDVGRWESLSEESQSALLDHELHHAEVVRNKVGAIKYDDANRPKIRLRKHDFQIGGFHAIASRHKHHALEMHAVECVNLTWKQMNLFEMEAA
jgi:hypothetical protein